MFAKIDFPGRNMREINLPFTLRFDSFYSQQRHARTLIHTQSRTNFVQASRI